MTNNLFSDIPTDLPEELFVSLQSSSNVRIEKIVSMGKRNRSRVIRKEDHLRQFLVHHVVCYLTWLERL
jgi:hypothetical protein